MPRIMHLPPGGVSPRRASTVRPSGQRTLCKNRRQSRRWLSLCQCACLARTGSVGAPSYSVDFWVKVCETSRSEGAMNRQVLIERRSTRVAILLSVLILYASPSRADSWDRGPSMPTPRRALAAAASINGAKIYAIGGSDRSQVFNKVEVYDVPSGAWSTVAGMPTYRYELAAVTGPDDKIYAIGGVDPNAATLFVVEAYNQ